MEQGNKTVKKISPKWSKSKSVIFWGAGATAFAGYKTFQNFSELFWPTRDTRSVLQISTKEEHLLKKIHRSLINAKYPTTLDSYLRVINELFITTESLQASTILRDDLANQNPLLRANATDLSCNLGVLRDAICNLTADHYRSDPFAIQFDGIEQNTKKLVNFIDKILNLSTSNQINIFTTNYDIFMEHAFWFKENNYQKKGWIYDNGFVIKKSHATVNIKANETELNLESNVPYYGNWKKNMNDFSDNYIPLYSHYGEERATDKKICLHRLHGCVGWLRGARKETTTYFNINNKDQFESFTRRFCVSYPGHEDCLGLPPHVDSWRKFQNELSRAEILIIVGFAFRDPDVLSVMGRVLSHINKKLRIIVVDPTLTTLEHLFSRVEEKTIDYAPPYPKWRELLTEKNTFFIDKYFPIQSTDIQLIEGFLK